jgi:hypothetical protein
MSSISLGVTRKSERSTTSLNLHRADSFISTATGRARAVGSSKVGKKKPRPTAVGESPTCAANFTNRNRGVVKGESVLHETLHSDPPVGRQSLTCSRNRSITKCRRGARDASFTNFAADSESRSFVSLPWPNSPPPALTRQQIPFKPEMLVRIQPGDVRVCGLRAMTPVHSAASGGGLSVLRTKPSPFGSTLGFFETCLPDRSLCASSQGLASPLT